MLHVVRQLLAIGVRQGASQLVSHQSHHLTSRQEFDGGEGFSEAVTAVCERGGVLHNEVTTVDELVDGADAALVCALPKN